MKNFKTVEEYINNNIVWNEHILQLRTIMLETGLIETVKWGIPVYTNNKKNIVGIGAFKSFVSLWFYNGVFLNDKENKLINAQEGVTKALRQWRFDNIVDIRESSKVIKKYIYEAIEIEVQGLSIKPEKKKSIALPKIFEDALNDSSKLEKAFSGFTQSKQREFIEHIVEAKREQTKIDRLQKIIPMILIGEGLNDKYKKK